MLIGDVLDDVVEQHPRPQLVGRLITGALQDRLACPTYVGQVAGVHLKHAELPLHI